MTMTHGLKQRLSGIYIFFQGVGRGSVQWTNVLFDCIFPQHVFVGGDHFGTCCPARDSYGFPQGPFKNLWCAGLQ